MSNTKSDVIIIGAGLTGLTLAYRLRKENINVTVLEARSRIGGRIHTKYEDGKAPLEMGATWLGAKHSSLMKLLQDLKVGIFEQVLGDTAIYEAISTSPPQLVNLPENTDPSFRVKGGTSRIINLLGESLKPEDLHLNEHVQSIQLKDDGITIQTNSNEFEGKLLISTLPPNLLIKTIEISPSLPDDVIEVAKQTHTWMGESIKISLTFEKAFWREEEISGTIFSNVGPIPEMYDHSNVEDSAYALKGFLNGAYFSVTKEERLELVLKQLEKYYGEEVRDFKSYEETVWRNEPFTFVPYDAHVLPHQNNGHLIYNETYLNNRFIIAGAETSTNYPGYMDGAVRSANRVAEQVKAYFAK